MKMTRRNAVLTMALIAAALATVELTGCVGGPKSGSIKATQTIEILGHKNQALGSDQMPAWVVAYRDEGGISGVTALPKFKDFYAFVGESTASTQVMATEWAGSFEARQQVSTKMVSGVATTLQAVRNGMDKRQGSSDSEASNQGNVGSVDNDIKNALSAVSLSQVVGLQKEGDYWLLTRTHNTNGTTTDEYRALVLYIIDKESLKDQVNAMLEEVKKNVPNMINLLTAGQATISQKGIDYGAPSN
jgi:hypothetical protein